MERKSLWGILVAENVKCAQKLEDGTYEESAWAFCFLAKPTRPTVK